MKILKRKSCRTTYLSNLWLLDPSWDRAATNTRKEETITREFKNMEDRLTDEERAGRVDIRYQTLGGKHVIIELKKYSRRVNVYDLAKQISKYKNTLVKCLCEKFPNSYTNVFIEVICILGKPPVGGDDPNHAATILATSSARYVTYDELIDQANHSYREYLDAQIRVGKLAKSLDKIYAEFPS